MSGVHQWIITHRGIRNVVHRYLKLVNDDASQGHYDGNAVQALLSVLGEETKVMHHMSINLHNWDLNSTVANG